MSKETYYFSHDFNAIQDPKMMAAISECGLSAIGMYWILIEILHQQPEGKITISQYKQYIKFYCSFENRGEQVLNTIEQVLIKSELLVEHDNFVFSNRVLDNKKLRTTLSEKRSYAGKMSAKLRLQSTVNKDITTSVEQVLTSDEQNSTKERKGKEIKGNNNYDLSFVSPIFETCFFRWLKYKREIKDYYKTQDSIEQAYKNLLKLSCNNPANAEIIVSNSIGNGYKGLFELKHSLQQTVNQGPPR